jgi:hypothetical protein
LFDWALRFLEITCLRQDLLNLTDGMLSQSLCYHDEAEDKAVKEAAFKNAVYFNVAKLLLAEGELKDVPANIKEIMEKEIALINKHAGFSKSPLFGVDEDYSQYLPRGHYSRSPEFEKYFKATMWYGRMGFRLAPQEENSELLQAVLICKALRETKLKGETALAVWKRIYETTAFFAGRSDDITLEEYLPLIDEIYGKDIKLSNLSDKKKTGEFAGKCKLLRKPKILSTIVTDIASRDKDWREQTLSFRLMGQRFTPDAYIFQNLVYDKVKRYTGNDPQPFTAVAVNGVVFRGFPRGLDVMSVFGSEVAGKILDQDQDSRYEGYQAQLEKLKKEYLVEDEGIWTQDLYGSRIWTFKSILPKPQTNAPSFMRSEAWTKKQLNATLSAWAELKHDTILYSKQAYTGEQRAMGKVEWIRSLPAEVVQGYVEPVPEFYLRTKATIAKLRLKITSLGFPADKALENNLKYFEGLLDSLAKISEKELAGNMLSEEDYCLIEDIGARFGSILRYSHYLDVEHKFRSEMDNKMPIVADVFTDVNSSQVLEEAIGYPAEIFVIANVAGKEKVCLGAAYSYYEFKQPQNNRLTDEEWRKTLKENKQPSAPSWLNEIAVIPGTR